MARTYYEAGLGRQPREGMQKAKWLGNQAALSVPDLALSQSSYVALGQSLLLLDVNSLKRSR